MSYLLCFPVYLHPHNRTFHAVFGYVSRVTRHSTCQGMKNSLIENNTVAVDASDFSSEVFLVAVVKVQLLGFHNSSPKSKSSMTLQVSACDAFHLDLL